MKRFTFGAFLHELPHELAHLDHALPHTLPALLTRPGPTIRAYLAGKRARVYSPIGLLFLLSGLLALAMVTLHISGITKVTTTGEITGDTRTEAAMIRAIVKLADRIPDAVVQYRAWLQIAGLPVVAIGPYVVLRKRTGLGFGEQIVAATMVGVGDAALSIAFVPLFWLTRNHHGIHSVVVGAGEIVTFAYSVWAYAELQADGRDDGGARWLRGFVACVGTYVVSAAAVLGLITCILVVLAEGFYAMRLIPHH